MHSTGILLPPQQPDGRSTQQKELWTKTNERIGAFLGPEFMNSILPEPTMPVQPLESEEQAGAQTTGATV